MAKRLRRMAGAVKQLPRSVRWSAAAAAVGAFMLWLVLYAPSLFVPTPSDVELRQVDAAKRLELQNDVGPRYCRASEVWQCWSVPFSPIASSIPPVRGRSRSGSPEPLTSWATRSRTSGWAVSTPWSALPTTPLRTAPPWSRC